jgi:hypothetical protein
MVSAEPGPRRDGFARGTWTAAVLLPWRLARLAPLESRWAARFAVLNVLLAAVLAAGLSTWTYLIGKGLVLGLDEMDLGHDDLPPDSALQVGLGLALSGLLWVFLLGLLPGVCRIVARRAYAGDPAAGRRAVGQARVLTAWLPVWALLMFALNGALHGELRHPAAAIRARAQLRLDRPGEARHLDAPARFLPLVFGFPALWALGLLPPAGSARGRLGFASGVAVASWLCLLLVFRLLPWSFITAWTG